MLKKHVVGWFCLSGCIRWEEKVVEAGGWSRWGRSHHVAWVEADGR